MKALGFFCGFLVWLVFSSVLACILAAPFWLLGYNLIGCFVWLLAGMPFGMILAFAVLANMNNKPTQSDDSVGDVFKNWMHN
jgi:hypothetical protein